MRILDKILRAGEGRTRHRLESITAMVAALEDDFTAMTDDELAATTDEYRTRLAGGETVDDLLPEAFATVREASRRVLGMRHFDVQIMGGAALHLGNIAEMRTGEGKTLVSTLPAYLNALTGRGVHVVTVNDYLASRDAAHVGAVHTFLGLTVGVITSDMTEPERRAAYACDITYGTNNELGFDYLRDNMATSPDGLVQRGHHFAIVDEVDSILIDEARTPLILSGPGEAVTAWYAEFARVAAALVRDVDYDVDEKKHTIGLLEPGVTKVEDWVGADNLYAAAHTRLVGYLNQAVRAKELYAPDKDYVVIGGEVLIVDEHTGRVLAGRRYSDGLHQALEAKEGVPVQEENQTLATITLQNYFRLYERLCGMTGTAESEAAELSQTYQLGVVPIPTNKPNQRVDQPDVVYRTEDAKFAAVVADIADRHAAGQPVLVGTTSVEKSETLSARLTDAGIPHNVLNAKQHEREAHVIAQAGRAGAVTVATNMAGRGTDIVLGGNATELATAQLAGAGLEDDSPEWERAWPDALTVAEQVVAHERATVFAAGGLYVLGTERHESRRIDNQLRGRAGRQGDPGETRFYLSLEDELIRKFAGQSLTRAMDLLGAGDVPIESGMVNRSVASAQSSMESRNYQTRKDVLKYDDVLSRQREVIYAERRRVLAGHDVSAEIRTMARTVIASLIGQLTGPSQEWNLEQLLTDVRTFIPVPATVDELVDDIHARTGKDVDRLDPDDLADALTSALEAFALDAYDAREKQVGADRMRQLERGVLLTVVDARWREHLFEMDYMREGIHMRSMAQRDPLVEYQREAYDMFLALLSTIKEETVGYIFHVEVPEAAPTPVLDVNAVGDDLGAILGRLAELDGDDLDDALGELAAKGDVSDLA